MGVFKGGVRKAVINRQGNVKLLSTKYLLGKDVTQVHNLSEKQLIAFVEGDNNFYLVDKESGSSTPIANPSGNDVYHCIQRVEDILVIRCSSSLLLLNCVTLNVDHFVQLNNEVPDVYQNLMLAERES